MRMKIQSLGASLFFLALGPLSFASAKVGQPAPSLEVTAFDGKVFNLSKVRGKTIILHFWATWCPACRREMPILNRFYQKQRDHVEMIALTVDRARDRDPAIKEMRELAFPGAMLIEAKVNDFGTPGSLPITYVINPQGIVRKIFSPGSGSDEDELTETSLIRALDSDSSAGPH